MPDSLQNGALRFGVLDLVAPQQHLLAQRLERVRRASVGPAALDDEEDLAEGAFADDLEKVKVLTPDRVLRAAFARRARQRRRHLHFHLLARGCLGLGQRRRRRDDRARRRCCTRARTNARNNGSRQQCK